VRTVVTLMGVAVAVAGCTGSTPMPSVSATPSSSPSASAQASLTPEASRAQQIADGIVAHYPVGSVVAAAYVTAAYGDYTGSLPDTAGLPSAPASTDIVLIIEVAGWLPPQHSTYLGNTHDTSVIVTYDLTLGAEVGRTWAYDPSSPDIPGSTASPGDRFSDLRHFGTPIPLTVATGS
jgi:hypothetical protein